MKTGVLLAIAFFVTLLHLGMILWSSFSPPQQKPLVSERRLAVQTLRLNPVHSQPPEEKKALRSAKPPLAAKVPISPSPQKKPPQKTALKKQAKASNPEPVPAATKSSKKTKLLAEAQENLKHVAERKGRASSLDTIKTIEILNIDLSLASRSEEYNGALTAALRRSLRLPEPGEVKIELTLDREGHVVFLRTLSTQSENNRFYIEKKLPTLTLPPFGTHLEKEHQHTFTLVLTHDL